jgi:hypothetical protein
VTIEQLDAGTWIVRRQPGGVRLKRVLIPLVDHLPREPEWEKVEDHFTRHASRRLTPPEL